MNNSTREQNKARRAVRTAISRNQLARPEICERCLLKPTKARDGRVMIHAHHTDYSKPLKVSWICSKCHKKETPTPSGENSHWNKFNWGMITEIRKIYTNQEATITDLAEKYGVVISTISKIVNNKTWLLEREKHL